MLTNFHRECKRSIVIPPGDTLGILEWGCAAGTLEPASSAEFCYPLPNQTPKFPPPPPPPPHPRIAFRLSCENLNLPICFFIYIFEWQFPVSVALTKIFNQLISLPFLDPISLIYIPYPRKNCWKPTPYLHSPYVPVPSPTPTG